jgi:hypothetical protein
MATNSLQPKSAAALRTAELNEPDTVFGTGEFTAEDRAAMQQFMAESRKKPENQAAVAAMKQQAAQVVVKVDEPLSTRALASAAA